MIFLKVWIGYTIFGVSVFSAAFVWAVRARQFTDLGRAHHIALRSAEPIERADDRVPSRLDRYTVLFLFLLLALVLAATLVVAMGHS